MSVIVGPAVLTFEEAVEQADERQGGRSLLLGNGFSMSFSPSFDYRRLLDVADFGGRLRSQRIREVFRQTRSADFERVVHRLIQTARTLGTYEPHSPTRAKLRRDAERVRWSLASAIARVHPARIDDVGEGRLVAAHDFLRDFRAVFTLNYDLLLYWAILRREQSPFDDGFRRRSVRLLHVAPPEQNVTYLHGALHLSEDVVLGALPETVKAEWDGLTPLVDRLQDDLDQGDFPLIVMEGESQQKQRSINASPYLSDAQDRLRSIGGSLFTFGWAFGESDDHVIEAIRRSNVRRIYVGLHGRPGSGRNPWIVGRARTLEAEKPSLHVRFWDTATATTW